MAEKARKDDDNESEYEIEGELQDVHEQPTEDRKAADPGEVLGGKRKQKVSVASPETKRRFKARLFSLKNNRTKKTNINLAGPANRSYDYEELYEEDEYGKEAFPEARVWKVYNDETGLFDQERIDAWRDALDVLLVFIGLFSAIVTTFVVQTSQALQPDYTQMMVIVTLEILRTISNATIPNDSFSSNVTHPRFGQATPSYNDKVVNGLWFTSLAVSLSTALMTVLTKQWLYHYTTSTSGTSRERARIRQFRYGGLQAYRVPLIIDLLPILLHLALALFLVGLAIFLSPLHEGIAGIVGGITGVSYILYIITIYLPIRDPRCPYKSPLSFYAYRLYHGVFLKVASHLSTSTFARHLRSTVTSLRSRATSSRVWVSCSSLASRAAQSTLSLVVFLYFGTLSRSLLVLCCISSSPPPHVPQNPLPSDTSEDPLSSNTSEESSPLDMAEESLPSSTPEESSPTLNTAERRSVQCSGNQLDVDAMVYLYKTSANSTVRSIALEAFCGLAPSDANVKEVYTILDADLHEAAEKLAPEDARPGHIPNVRPGMENRHDRLLRALCVGSRVQAPPQFQLRKFYLAPSSEGTKHLFRVRLLLSFRRAWSHKLLAIFLECAHLSLPLPVWATLVHLAMRDQPRNFFLNTILLSVIPNPPVGNLEVGVVSLEDAMHHSTFVRHLVLRHLGIHHSKQEDVLSLLLSSFCALLSPGNTEELRLATTSDPFDTASAEEEISVLLFKSLPTIIRSIASHARSNNPTSKELRERICHVLLLLFTSPHLHSHGISWRLIDYALNAWSSAYVESDLTSSALTKHFLRQFCKPDIPNPDDLDHIRNSATSFLSIFRDTGEELAWAICSNLLDLDLIPVNIEETADVTCPRLFWSFEMCQVMVQRTYRLQWTDQARTHGFTQWLEYIHAPRRLVFLYRQLLNVPPYQEPLWSLCSIDPRHPNWPITFESWLLLFDNQADLDKVISGFEDEPKNVRQFISKRLNRAKSILEKHHHILRDSKFSIPQFDDNDIRITEEQLQRELDDILKDSVFLRHGDYAYTGLWPTRIDSDPPTLNSSRPGSTTTTSKERPLGLVDHNGSPADTINGENLSQASNEAANVVEVAVEMGGLITTNHSNLSVEGLVEHPTREWQFRGAESDLERGEGDGLGRCD